MGLLEEAQQQTKRPGSKCTVAILVANNPGLEAELGEALASLELSTSAIARALKNRGHRMNVGTLQRHRNKACSCHL